jgi:hypothetical protein
MNAPAVTALSTAISLLLLWVLLYWFYRRYRVDYFRHNLFVLRSELFDHARKGELAFDAPAYTILRTTLNGFLRYAERIGFLSTLMAGKVVREIPADSELLSLDRQWTAALETLEPGVRAELIAIRSRMHYEVFQQVLFSSPLFALTLIPLLFLLLFQLASGTLVWRAMRSTYGACENSFRGVLKPLDAIAFGMGGRELAA